MSHTIPLEEESKPVVRYVHRLSSLELEVATKLIADVPEKAEKTGHKLLKEFYLIQGGILGKVDAISLGARP